MTKLEEKLEKLEYERFVKEWSGYNEIYLCSNRYS